MSLQPRSMDNSVFYNLHDDLAKFIYFLIISQAFYVSIEVLDDSLPTFNNIIFFFSKTFLNASEAQL